MILDLFSLAFWWVEYKNGFLCLFGMGRNMVRAVRGNRKQKPPHGFTLCGGSKVITILYHPNNSE